MRKAITSMEPVQDSKTARGKYIIFAETVLPTRKRMTQTTGVIKRKMFRLLKREMVPGHCIAKQTSWFENSPKTMRAVAITQTPAGKASMSLADHFVPFKARDNGIPPNSPRKNIKGEKLKRNRKAGPENASHCDCD